MSGIRRQPKLGSGKRFEKVEKSLSGKVDDPGAVAYSIGAKKYGKSKMAKLAKAGKARKAK